MRDTDQLDFEPDDDAIYRFLQFWFAACNRGSVELGWTDEHSGQLNRFRCFALDDLNAAARFAAETNSVPGRSVYFRPATVTARPNDQAARDTDVVQIPGTWVDCDTVEAVDRVLAATVAPSIGA
jgi:hypothetical protein